MAEFGPEPTFRTYLQILRHRKSWVGSITALGRAAYVRYRQAVAARQLAAAVAERRSLISGIEQQLRSFGSLPQQGNPCGAPEREQQHAGSQPAVHFPAG